MLTKELSFSDMHILVVNPWLVGEYSLGGAKRIFRMLRYFARSEDVSLACFRDNHQGRTCTWPSEAYSFCRSVITAPLPKISKLARGVKFLLDPRPGSVYVHSSLELRQKIQAFVEQGEIDFIHVEFLGMASSVLDLSKSIPRVLVSQEVMSLAKRVNTSVKEGFKNFVQRPKIKRYEKLIAPQFDHCYCITNEEKTYLENIGVANSRLFPHVVNTEEFASTDHEKEEHGTLLFLGNFQHKPNLHALHYFVREIFPSVRRQYPSAVFHVVGAHLHDSLLRGLNTNNVRIHGEVEDIRAYYDMTSIFVNPIVSGGGMRGKVLEAMAGAKAVVSTRLGVQGIDVRDQEEVLLAEAPQAFANAVVSLLREPARRRNLGDKARAKIRECYEENRVFARLLSEYHGLLREKQFRA